MNGDGKPDLVVSSHKNANSSGNNAAVQVLLGKGDGTFTSGGSMSGLGVFTDGLAIGDVDGDGKPDVVLTEHGAAYPYDPGRNVRVLFGNGDGTLFSPKPGQAPEHYGTGQAPVGLVLADLNGDGRLDAATANSLSSSVTVLLGTSDQPVAALASLVSAIAQPNLVRLEWFAPSVGFSASIERRTTSDAWSAIGSVSADGNGAVRFEDANVQAGQRYGYRLAYASGGATQYTAETWVTVPAAARFALEGLRPNPGSGALLEVALSLPDAGAARLEMLDVSGRRLASRELAGLGPGELQIRLAPGAPVKPGLYFLRLTREGAALVSRACVVR